MKNILTAALLWTGILMPNLNAQTYLKDTIRIMNGEQISAIIMHFDIHQLKTDATYKELILSFQTHLESIKDQIPDYLNYQIVYVKDVNLIIEEITGTSKYKVENGKIAAAFNSNRALLQSGNLKIELLFNVVDELLETDYNVMIEKALSKIKAKKKKFITLVRPLNYTYSFGKDELTKGNQRKKEKARIGGVTALSVGLYKNDPIYDYMLGFGVQFSKERVAYIFGKVSYQYDKEQERFNEDLLWGFAMKASKLGAFHIAFPWDSKAIYHDLSFQFGFTIYPVKGFSITTNLNYLKNRGSKFFPGISIGYGL